MWVGDTYSLSPKPDALFRVENGALDPRQRTPEKARIGRQTSQTSDLMPRAPPYTWSSVTSPTIVEPYSLDPTHRLALVCSGLGWCNALP